MKKHILLVDDTKTVLMSEKMMLGSKDYDITIAVNGMDALEKMDDKRPDLILLDIMMPEMNGIEVLKRIKKIDANTRIIMITAFGDVESYLDSMELGAFEYINKPFETEELLELIERVVAA
jgi:two-component system response regulator (stage 0 sporulation protein F)